MEYICSNCGKIGNPRQSVKGSVLIELFLWLFFIIPGVIYSIWRLSTKALVCPYCGSAALLPVGTPKGQELLAKYAPTQAEVAQVAEEAAKIEAGRRSSRTSCLVLIGIIVILILATWIANKFR